MLITILDHFLYFTTVVNTKMCYKTATALHFPEHLFCSHATLSEIFDQILRWKTPCTLRSKWTILIIDNIGHFSTILQCYRNATTEMYHDQLAVFILFSMLAGIFHGCRSCIQVVSDPLSAEFFQTCDLQNRHHLINGYTIINESRNPQWFCDCICNNSTKVRSMLHRRFIFQLPYHIVVYTVSTCLKRRK